MSMKQAPIIRLGIIQGHSVLRFLPPVDWRGVVTYVSDMDIDADGVGDDGKPNNIYSDPYYQPDTSLHNGGAPLNSLKDKYVVVNPMVVSGVKEVVLGCQAMAVNLITGEWSWAVVGDIGPSKKDGEGSIALAGAIGVNKNPVTGGTSNPDIAYALWPGKAAYVDGKVYTLQPS